MVVIVAFVVVVVVAVVTVVVSNVDLSFFTGVKGTPQPFRPVEKL